MYVFGYGSLMNAESAKETLLRDISVSDLIPAFLCGYRRTWALKEQVVSDTLGKEVTAVFLDIDISNQAKTNGVLIQVNQNELELLKIREKNYNCIEVTSSVVAYESVNNFPLESVFTFVSKQDNRVKDKDEDLYILKKYIEKVENACLALGSNFLNSYHNTTEKPPLSIIEGGYKFVKNT